MQRPKFGYIALDKDGVDEFGRKIIEEKRYKASKNKSEPPFIAYKTFKSLFDAVNITSLSRIVAVRLPQTAKDGRYGTFTEGAVWAYTIDTLYEFDYKTLNPNSKKLSERILALRTLPSETLTELIRGKDEDIVREILRFGRKEDLDFIMKKSLKTAYAEAILQHKRKEDLEKYRKSHEVRNRVLVAKYGYDEDLDVLVSDKYAEVKVAVAKRNRKKDREILLKDTDPTVLFALASVLPKSQIPKIKHNNDSHVLCAIMKYADKAYINKIIKTAPLDPLVLTELAIRGFPEHFNIVRASTSHMVIREQLRHQRTEDFVYYYDAAMHNAVPDYKLLAILVQYANDKYLKKLRTMHNPAVNASLAKRGLKEDLDRLVLSEDESILKEVALKGREEDAEILIKSKYQSIRQIILSFGKHKDITLCLKDQSSAIRRFAREIKEKQIVERKAKKTLLSGKPGLNGNMRGYEDD